MIFQDVVRFDPEHPGAHTNLANLYVAEGEYEQAIPHYLEVLRLTGNKNFSVQVNLGNCYAKLGKYQQALEHYAMAQQLDPTNEKLIRNLRLAQQKMKSMHPGR